MSDLPGKLRARIGIVLIGVALAALPFAVGATFGNSWVRIIDFALLYIMLALGLNIVVGFAGLLDLGYIAFYAVGAYLYALLSSPHLALAFPEVFGAAPGWPIWLVLPIGALVAGVFGVLLGTPTLKLRGDYLAIVTLGFGEIIRIFLNNLNAPLNLTNGPQGINNIQPVQIAGQSLGRTMDVFGFAVPGVHLHYYFFLALTLLVVFVCVRLQDSRLGRAWVAIREDELAARACGINTRNVKLLAFGLGATFGGVAGGLFAGFQGFVSPESFGLLESIMVLCMVVLGGMGNIAGVVLGAVLLALLPEVLRWGAAPLQQWLFGKVLIDPESLRLLLFGVALVLVMRWRPAGLWPSALRRRELAAHGDAA
ncbi:MAG: ABC transporter ATP-binding protein [Methyloversatilis sp.]|jgi:branched-chain amino acid transport system permease protein|nr:ABC transporter ATP-binding protein [Methyloversatilis sp.]MBP6193445.1 ABC transporter ATP-binding protein [Methyloversatilis sp.]